MIIMNKNKLAVGSSFKSDESICLPIFRHIIKPSYAYDVVGFRFILCKK